MPQYPLRTPAAANLLGVSYARLYALGRYEKLHPAPLKDAHLHVVWTKADLTRAKTALASTQKRPRKPAAE